MNKILLTGDLHISKGIFVDIGLDYLEHLTDFCKEHDDKIEIVFLGDIFEKSARIYNEAFVPVFKKLHEMSKTINMSFIVGNHDIYSANMEDSIVHTFSASGRVIKDWYSKHGLDFLSYTKDEEKLLHFINSNEVKKYLFTHLSIADFKFDNNYHVNEKIAFKPDLFSDYMNVFSGHFHNHQSKHNIVYVGSPYQITFSEEGQKKGFVLLDYENSYQWKFVEYNNAPEHLTISVEDIKKLDEIDFKNKFIKVKINKKVDEFVKLKYILYERGALTVTPDFYTDEINIENQETSVDMSSSVESIVREHINSIKADGIGNKKLLDIFDNKILKKV